MEKIKERWYPKIEATATLAAWALFCNCPGVILISTLPATLLQAEKEDGYGYDHATLS